MTNPPSRLLDGLSGTAERLKRFIPLGIAILVLAIATSTVSHWPVGAFEDDAIYTVLGKSLAEGSGYRLINLPGEPNATHFPPGYPALLAVLWRMWPVFPDNLVLFKFTNGVLLAVAAAGTYVFARRLSLTPFASAATALGSTLSVVVLLLTGMVLSEPLFLALLLPVLLTTERAVESGRVRTALLAGALLGVLALTRTLGLFAIPPAIALLLWRRRYAAAVALTSGAAALVAPWQIWVALHQHEVPAVIAGKYGSYTGWVVQGYMTGGFEFLWQVVAKNVRDVFYMVSYLHAPVGLMWVRIVTFATLGGLLILGCRALAQRAPATLGFLLCYVVVVLLWPFEPNRFFLGLWPVLGVCAALGVQTVVRWQPTLHLTHVARYATLGACVGLAVGVVAYNGRGYQHSWWLPVQRSGGERLKPIVEWVAHNTAMSDLVATDHDPAVYLYTGRRAVPTTTWIVRERVTPLTPEEDVLAVSDLLRELRPSYYVPASVLGMRTATTLARRSPPALRYLAATANGAAYAVVRP